jgi:multiple sugar transport system permease protein
LVSIRSILKFVIIALALIPSLFPIYWMVMTAFKPIDEWVTKEAILITTRPTLENFIILFNPEAVSYVSFTAIRTSIHHALYNSLILSVGGTLVSLVVGTLAAYAMSRFKTGGNAMPQLILMFRMMPPIAAMIPITIMFSAFRWVDTHQGLIITYGLFNLPFVVWLMKSFFDDVPREVDEAALVDGWSYWGTFRRVVLPLTYTGVAVTALFIYILTWSDFLVALLLTNVRADTIPIFLANYTTAYGEMYGPLAATGTFAIIPPVVIGLAIQRYLVRGFTFGAIKR